MKPDPDHNHQEEDDCVSLRIKISELERKLRDERDNFELLRAQSELAKLSALQETEKFKREWSSLNEQVGRLEEDCKILREREAVDRERIKGLLDNIERKDREINMKFVEFKVENRDLVCAKRRTEDEARVWMNKYGDLLFQESKLVDEILRLKGKINETENEKGNGTGDSPPKHYDDDDDVVVVDGPGIMQGTDAKNVIHIDGDDDDEQVPKGTLNLRSCEEESLLFTPEPSRKRILVAMGGSDSEAEGDHHLASASAAAAANSVEEEDNMTLSQLREKRLTSSMPLHSQASRAGKFGQKSSVVSPSSSARKVTDTRIRSFFKRCPHNESSGREYTGRIASSEQILSASRRAETLQSNLKSCHPSFIKTMVPSHVSGGFWFGLPAKFCMTNLPSFKTRMILEDEEGVEYGVTCIGEKTALSGGWRGFALAHNLEIGDALVFELSEPIRFKVYILKAILDSSRDLIDIPDEDTVGTTRRVTVDQLNMQDIDLSLYSSKGTSNI